MDEQRLLQWMNWSLDRLLAEDPKRVVLHLGPRAGDAGDPAAAPA